MLLREVAGLSYAYESGVVALSRPDAEPVVDVPRAGEVVAVPADLSPVSRLQAAASRDLLPRAAGPVRRARDEPRSSSIRTTGTNPVTPAPPCRGGCAMARPARASTLAVERNGAAPESNRPSVGLPRRTSFEDSLGHRARAAPPPTVSRHGEFDGAGRKPGGACPASDTTSAGRRSITRSGGRFRCATGGSTCRRGLVGEPRVPPVRTVAGAAPARTLAAL